MIITLRTRVWRKLYTQNYLLHAHRTSPFESAPQTLRDMKFSILAELSLEHEIGVHYPRQYGYAVG